MDSIQENDFSVEVLSDKGPVEKIIYKGFNYYGMSEGTEYRVGLGNHTDRRVDATVWIDGEKVGTWRINPFSNVVIKNLVEKRDKFVLTEKPYNYLEKNLLRVVFKPEIYQWSSQTYNNPHIRKETDPTLFRSECNNNYTDSTTPWDKLNRRCNYRAGRYLENRPLFGEARMSTKPEYAKRGFEYRRDALGFDKNHRYGKVSPFEKDEIDIDNVTTIYARLVVDNDHSSYRREYNGIRQAPFNSKVPPLMRLEHPSRSNPCNVDSPLTLSQKYWFDRPFG